VELCADGIGTCSPKGRGWRSLRETLIPEVRCDQGSIPPNEKIKIIDMVTKLEEKMFEIEGYVDEQKSEQGVRG